MDYLGQTGRDALKGADILRTAPDKYSSSVEYADNPIAQALKNAAQVMTADLGTRIYYTQARQLRHPRRRGEGAGRPVEPGFRCGERLHGRPGRAREGQRRHRADLDRVRPAHPGQRFRHRPRLRRTAFIIGNEVNGGFYGEYPSLAEKDQLDGDLHFNNDFRSTYSTIAEQWLGLDPGSDRERAVRAVGLYSELVPTPLDSGLRRNDGGYAGTRKR